MSFLDRLRDKLRPREECDDYYEQEYYDEPYDGEPADDSLFGNTHRPEVESVAVYTRSGRPVDVDPTNSVSIPERGANAFSPHSPSLSASSSASPGFSSRMISGQLPPYIIRPMAYDDVQTIAQRVRTNQPVVLSFKNTSADCAKRILDFSFGLACGVGGSVIELGDRAFAVLPSGVSLSDADIDKLAAGGVINR